MHKTPIGLTGVVACMLIASIVTSIDFPTARAQSADPATYAVERALIENLQARYLFALDFKVHDLYVTTFTEDGILDVGYGHYEDDLVKVDGEWLFARRRIYNEGNPAWAAPPGNPAW